jgi:hypothetical protein
MIKTKIVKSAVIVFPEAEKIIHEAANIIAFLRDKNFVENRFD